MLSRVYNKKTPKELARAVRRAAGIPELAPKLVTAAPEAAPQGATTVEPAQEGPTPDPAPTKAVAAA